MLSITKPLESERSAVQPSPANSIKVGFVMHAMQVAGAEVLVAEIIRQLRNRVCPTIFCLDAIGQLGEQLQAEGVEVVCLHRKPGLDRGLAFRLARETRERQIEILHAHQYTPFFYAALAKLVGASGKIILTEHGRHWPDIVSSKRRWCNRLLISRFANRINACSEFSAAALAQVDGFPGDRIDVIYNGIDCSRFEQSKDRNSARSRLGLDPDRRYVAMIARFHPVKDHKTMLRAFYALAEIRDDTDLLLVGDGELRPPMEALAKELGIEKRVQFWGVRHDVPDILQAVDLFALSSLSEAASLTLLEAMATGCAVVVTDVGGNPEIVTDGQTGRLVPRGDHLALSQALGELLADPVSASLFGAAGRQRVLEEFRLEQSVAEYERLYSELAGVD